MTKESDRLAALGAMPGQLDTKEALVHWYCTHRKTIMDALTATVDREVVEAMAKEFRKNRKVRYGAETEEEADIRAMEQALLRLRGEG